MTEYQISKQQQLFMLVTIDQQLTLYRLRGLALYFSILNLGDQALLRWVKATCHGSTLRKIRIKSNPDTHISLDALPCKLRYVLLKFCDSWHKNKVLCNDVCLRDRVLMNDNTEMH